MREAASDCFVPVGLLYDELCASEHNLRAAHSAVLRGGDCAYCAAGMETVARLSAEGIPVVGHVGPVPSKWTWTGGFEMVGKTAETAMQVFKSATARWVHPIFVGIEPFSLGRVSSALGAGCIPFLWKPSASGPSGAGSNPWSKAGVNARSPSNAASMATAGSASLIGELATAPPPEHKNGMHPRPGHLLDSVPRAGYAPEMITSHRRL